MERETTGIIFTEDLKHMVYLAATAEDVELLNRMIIRYGFVLFFNDFSQPSPFSPIQISQAKRGEAPVELCFRTACDASLSQSQCVGHGREEH